MVCEITNREDYLGRTFSCDCGAIHQVPTLRIELGAGSLDTLPEILRYCYLEGHGKLICDLTTWEVAGRKVMAMGIPNLTPHLIQEPRPHTNFATANEVKHTVASSNYLVSCGSGTVTDLTKYAAHALGLPFIAIATAPSMNGYTSGVVAMMEAGIKKTIPATPALAMIGDTDILAQAPLPMLRAGLGDLVSKSVCNADWQLDHQLHNTHFCPLPFTMIANLEEIYLPQSAQITARNQVVIKALIEAIAYSGISMVLAGSSAPASGGEHLISHALDMRAALEGNDPLDFHGTQVGISTLVSARLYEYFLKLSRKDIDWLKLRNSWIPLEQYIPHLKAQWNSISEGIINAFSRKHPSTASAHIAMVDRLIAQWDSLQTAVSPFVQNSSRIYNALLAAGAKTSYRELGLTRDDFIHIVKTARFIRNRYSILDLLGDLQMLDEAVDQVVD